MTEASLARTACLLVSMVVGVSACACSSSDTRSPIKSFADGGCKKHREDLAFGGTRAITQAIVATDYDPEVAGLKCIAWETVGEGTLAIDLYNFESGCGIEWSAEGSIGAGDELILSVVNPGCGLAGCGWCIYDWSFEVEGVDTASPLLVEFGIDTCPQDPDLDSYSFDLPVDTQSAGILCNYANFYALDDQAMALGECGTAGMPCNGSCSGESGAADLSCQGDLVCTTNGNQDQSICVRACAGDEDCGSAGVLSCEEGLCRPRAGW